MDSYEQKVANLYITERELGDQIKQENVTVIIE